MTMKGFSQRWTDFPDYILGITHEIWEERGIATLHEYYAEHLPMRFPSGIVQGRDAVIRGTLATLAEFPDRQLYGEDVIWCGDEDTGLLSSHRIFTTGTHTGDGYFGKATGRQFAVNTIADCAAKNNAIFDEWLIRDSAGIVLQLGMQPREFAAALVEREGGPSVCAKPFTKDQDVDGGYNSRGNDNEWGDKLNSLLTRMMAMDFAVVRKEYDRACEIHHAAGRGGRSWAAAEQAWMALRSAFPGATFSIDHQIGREDAAQAPRAAIRWSLAGKHEGHGLFGAPTGSDVYIMGITHAEFGPWGLRREYTLIDDISIWKQILMQSGAT